MNYETLVVETRGKVGLIRLNRPDVLNALNAKLKSELITAIEAFEANPNVYCAVLTGSDKAFAAGADITEMTGKSFADVQAEEFGAEWNRIALARKPIIAAVAGYALGEIERAHV